MMREEETDRSAFHKRAYATKKHHATNLHYDLRLAWDCGVLSWALPDGPSLIAGMPRKAIEMEDHRRANLLFEGLHDTGPIVLWDHGTWEPHLGFTDVLNSLANGILEFTLYGEKLKGSWTLVRTASQKNSPRTIWNIYKQSDSFARGATDRCVLEELPNSISTGRTLEEVVRDWMNPKARCDQQTKLFDGI